MLYTDACQKGAASVLLQELPDVPTKTVAYWFRSLIRAEKTYDTIHDENLAVVWAGLRLIPYLEGSGLPSIRIKTRYTGS